MWNPTVASFIVVMMMMMMMEVLCWPSMSNIAAIYTEKDMFLNFEEFIKTEMPYYCVIVFKNYYFIKYVHTTLSGNLTGREHIQMRVNEGFTRIKGPNVMIFFQTINATSSLCQDRLKICLVINLRLYFEDFESGAKLLDMTIDGYEANLHKYVGCYNKKYFKELKPIEDFRDCELTCPDTPFYGFNLEGHCVCLESLPVASSRLDLCQECPKKEAIFCGNESDSLSVYSKDSVQEILEIDPILYKGCFGYRNCPGCIEGRIRLMCFAINIDECILDEVCKHREETCVNTYGGYSCQCGVGFYKIDEKNCADIDECKTETSCDLNTTMCNNTYGDYECVCLEGHVKLDPMSRNSSCEVPKTPTEDSTMSLLLIILSILMFVIIIICGCLCFCRKWMNS